MTIFWRKETRWKYANADDVDWEAKKNVNDRIKNGSSVVGREEQIKMNNNQQMDTNENCKDQAKDN